MEEVFKELKEVLESIQSPIEEKNDKAADINIEKQ